MTTTSRATPRTGGCSGRWRAWGRRCRSRARARAAAAGARGAAGAPGDRRRCPAAAGVRPRRSRRRLLLARAAARWPRRGAVAFRSRHAAAVTPAGRRAAGRSASGPRGPGAAATGHAARVDRRPLRRGVGAAARARAPARGAADRRGDARARRRELPHRHRPGRGGGAGHGVRDRGHAPRGCRRCGWSAAGWRCGPMRERRSCCWPGSSWQRPAERGGRGPPRPHRADRAPRETWRAARADALGQSLAGGRATSPSGHRRRAAHGVARAGSQARARGARRPATGGTAEAAFGSGLQLLRAGRNAAAADAFDRAAALAPAGPAGGRRLVLAGGGAGACGRGAAGRTALAQFLDRYPFSARRGEAAVMLGWLLFDRGDRAGPSGSSASVWAIGRRACGAAPRPAWRGWRLAALRRADPASRSETSDMPVAQATAYRQLPQPTRNSE